MSGRSPTRRLAALTAVVLAVVGLASGAGGANGDGEFALYPQAGILWEDLYPTNFVDLDLGPSLRDYTCGTLTYDGHTGIDTIVRSFREMDIGMPVCAALDGRRSWRVRRSAPSFMPSSLLCGAVLRWPQRMSLALPRTYHPASE